MNVWNLVAAPDGTDSSADIESDQMIAATDPSNQLEPGLTAGSDQPDAKKQK